MNLAVIFCGDPSFTPSFQPPMCMSYADNFQRRAVPLSTTVCFDWSSGVSRWSQVLPASSSWLSTSIHHRRNHMFSLTPMPCRRRFYPLSVRSMRTDFCRNSILHNVREFILSCRLTTAPSLPVLFRLPTSCDVVPHPSSPSFIDLVSSLHTLYHFMWPRQCLNLNISAIP